MRERQTTKEAKMSKRFKAVKNGDFATVIDTVIDKIEYTGMNCGSFNAFSEAKNKANHWNKEFSTFGFRGVKA